MEVEVKQENQEVEITPEVQKSTAEEKPSWLPEKFESGEDLAKAYGELEKAYSAKEPNQEKDTISQAREGAEQQEQAEKAAGISLDKFFDEFQDKGELTEKSYTELRNQGIGKELVDNYIAGQQSMADNQLNQIYEAGGGKDGYAEVTKWASENLSEKEVSTFNKQVENGTIEEAILATQGLKARMENVEGKSPRLIKGGVSTATTSYQSTAEIIAAINDPRYESDTAYRSQVEDKIKRSNAIG